MKNQRVIQFGSSEPGNELDAKIGRPISGTDEIITDIVSVAIAPGAGVGLSEWYMVVAVVNTEIQEG